jgi:tryptophan 2,3-dioxygenase
MITQSPVAPGAHAAVYNDRGVIAESYHDLQALGVLDAARRKYPLPKASDESTLRAVFQAAEIGLLNLADVMSRAATEVEQGRVDTAVVKLFWARGFHRLMTRLGMIPQQLGLMNGFTGPSGILSIQDSPAFSEYLAALQRFDRSVLARNEAGVFAIEHVIAEDSLNAPQFNLVHLARICNHESTIWERSLACVSVPAPVPSYETFVVARGMRDAVYDRMLSGDTYFTQFRGLHQIPETLGEEVNDRIEQAIRDIRDRRLRQAIAQLRCVEVLAEAILASLPPIADNLSTSDYHRIRENLGLTSGSHSVCLRFHMFTHLYEQLWDELCKLIGAPPECSPGDAIDMIRSTDDKWQEDIDAWMIHQLANDCLRLRTFIIHWREEHLNLPRNNLGGDYTKSLTGSPDAVQAVKQMRDSARGKDPMLALARARRLVPIEADQATGGLTRYLDSRASLDSFLLSATGRVTQRRFSDVQERLGFFANRCPFRPPSKRRA